MKDFQALWRDPATPVVLRSTTTSPFGRKVRMCAIVLGLADRIERLDADTLDPDDTLRRQNPLGKMPCLIVGGETFYDSGVIVEMLDSLVGGGRLIPAAGVARWRALTRARLADGIAEAALLMVYEGRFHTPEQASARWLEHQGGKVRRALAGFEAATPDPTVPDVVSITLAAALGYLDWRRPVDWRDDHSALVRWLDAFRAAVPAFSMTERTLP